MNVAQQQPLFMYQVHLTTWNTGGMQRPQHLVDQMTFKIIKSICRGCWHNNFGFCARLGELKVPMLQPSDVTMNLCTALVWLAAGNSGQMWRPDVTPDVTAAVHCHTVSHINTVLGREAALHLGLLDILPLLPSWPESGGEFLVGSPAQCSTPYTRGTLCHLSPVTLWL